jgi:hypothetical protein
MIPKNINPKLNLILESERSEIEKLSEAFHLIANFQIENSKNECELFRAAGDRDSLIKEQIKHSTINHMLNVYAECYFRVTGSQWERGQTNEKR